MSIRYDLDTDQGRDGLRRLARTAELIDDLAAFLGCTPDEAQRLILRAVAVPPKPEPWRVVRPETIRRCGVLTGVHR